MFDIIQLSINNSSQCITYWQPALKKKFIKLYADRHPVLWCKTSQLVQIVYAQFSGNGILIPSTVIYGIHTIFKMGVKITPTNCRLWSFAQS